MTKDAFIREVRNVEAMLYHISKSILKNDSDCGDAVQETLLKAYEKLPMLKEEKKSSKKQSELLKKINNHFGFEDEEGKWFADTPIALTMVDDKEFKYIIDEFTNYKVISQKGKYENNGSRANMLKCNVSYEIVPKIVEEKDIENKKKNFIINSKTTINDILEKLGKD